jgi:hypothetical protein
VGKETALENAYNMLFVHGCCLLEKKNTRRWKKEKGKERKDPHLQRSMTCAGDS